MRSRTSTLYCFSPPIMIATCIIETVLFLYTVVRYKLTPVTRVAAALLLLLAIFQLCEFHVCRSGWIAGTWSRIGFVAITLLPPLGMHLIRLISGRGSRVLVWLSYVVAIGFSGIFSFSKSAFASHVCGGNYAIFQLSSGLGGFFFAYYYLELFVAIGLSLFLSVKAKPRIREALVLQAIGFLIFVLPTAVVNDIRPSTISGIPSIMCGFAVLYALILTFGIVPRVLKIKAKTSH